MTEQQAANLRSARALALSRAGIGVSVDETPSLSYADRIKYLDALAEIILTYRERFAPETIASAEATMSKNYEPLERYGVGDAYADFAGEIANQAQAINPFSEQNRGRLAATLSGVLALAAVAYFAVLAIRTSPRRNGITPASRK